MKHDNLKVGRIMIVDDEAELMTALCEAVAEQGYEAKGFTTGAEALKVLVEQDYDLLLTDLMMPEMDGIALLKAGLGIDPNLVCIIMTGHGTVQTAVEAMKKGAFDYILKPFKLNTIMPALSRAMEVRSLRMDNIQLKETIAIHELGKAVAFSTDLNAIMNKVADAVLQQCASDEVSIMLPTREGKELYVAIARGGHSEYIGERVTMERGIAGWVASNRETVIMNGKVDDPRFSPVNPRSDIRAAVSMPMMAGGNLVGVLNVNFTKSHRHITLGQVKALSILVSIISPILENTWLNIKVREAEEKYRSIFDNATEGIYQSTPEGRFIIANNEMAIMLGYDSPEELISTVTDMASQIYVNPEDRTNIRQLVENDGQAKSFETRFYRKDGSAAWVSMSTSAVRDKKGNILNYNGIAKDINERKLAEEELKESEEKFRRLVEGLKTEYFFYRHDTNSVLTYVSPSITYVLGYSPEEFCVHFETFLTDSPVNRNVSQQTAQSIQGIQRPPYEIEIRHRDGSILLFDVLESPVFDAEGKVVAVEGIAHDITERKRAEEQLKQTLENLRKAVATTIQVMVSAVEARDPYTSGHQLRVADIARAIATEMGLSQEKIDGIHMAGSIHDIGKLSIPAEILSKPGKLSAIEFSLIKEHPRKGYEMIKDVESPWPLAEIVYQHHERMNGSGYPRGLKGEDIIMEARILAVADVVEAMASHRPYRSGLGLDAALNEIEKNRGIFYDKTVLDACLRLFREKGFKIEEARY